MHCPAGYACIPERVVITIRGKKHWLWRAIDANGDVLDILVQTRRNAKAAKRFFKRLVARFGEPRVVITPLVTLLRNALSGGGQIAQLYQTDQNTSTGH